MTISAGYSARNESIKLSLLLTCLCLSLLYGDWLWRWDRLIYDAQSSMINHQSSDDIVIIAIDENSLQSIGRWPWPRSVHAELLNVLTEYQAKAVLFDVVFSETTPDPQDDQILATAIQKNGTVFLPVLVEQTRLRGQLIETLPLPSLTKAAANIGHVHVELDPDGIARSAYLYEGLGEARWPHITLALLKMYDDVSNTLTTQGTASKNTIKSPWTWVRKDHFLIPFIGPPGSFQTTSYINVINKQVLSETLKDKIVLVGVTASGLGDSLPTPVSGLAQPMPGIEINANILQAIKSGTMIETVNTPLLYFISSTLIMLPILLFQYLTPRMTLLLVISEISLIYLLSLISLHLFHIWIPFSSALICLLLSYPLWAWRRLEFTVKYLNTELEILSNEAREIEHYVSPDNAQPFEALQNLIPINGVSIYSPTNEMILNLGKQCNITSEKPTEHIWLLLSDNVYARKITLSSNIYNVCIRWKKTTPPDEQQTKLLKTYLRQIIKPHSVQAKTTVEVIESRIRDIKTTTDKLSYLRKFITDSLEQMADGVIVIDSIGIVTLANRQAIRQIGNATNNPLLHHPIQPVLDTLTLSSGESWEHIIGSLLENKHYENLQVRTDKNKDLVINVCPLYKSDNSITGFIINLSDITEIKDAQRKRNEILSFLSHDLRSPLVSILAMVEQSKTNNIDGELNKRIEKNINHTIKLAEDFVHLSRVESDDEITFTHINMSDVIANAIDTVWDQANIKNIQINHDSVIEAWVLGNGAILERIIINLLTNAIKYSNHNSIICVKLEIKTPHIICCVQDEGPGIAENDIPFLFDRFSRAQQLSKPSLGNNLKIENGIGLGLAFVYAAIKRHHGSINVKSTLGEGTEFCLSLPEQD